MFGTENSQSIKENFLCFSVILRRKHKERKSKKREREKKKRKGKRESEELHPNLERHEVVHVQEVKKLVNPMICSNSYKCMKLVIYDAFMSRLEAFMIGING